MSFQSILITGGTGYFGQGLVRFLLQQSTGTRICVFSRDEFKQAQMRERFGNDPRLRFMIGDVRDVDRLARAMSGCDLVIHAAALKRVEVGETDAEEMVKTNVLGAMNVIEAARRASMSGLYGRIQRRRVVALSTDKACEPMNCYGASKLCAEKLFLAANNSTGHDGPLFAVTRYGNVAGSTGSVIPTWRAAIERGSDIRVTDPNATRFWMTLDEAVDLVWQTALSMQGGELAIPDLPAYSVGDLLSAMLADRAMTDVPLMHVTGLGQGEKAHESMRPGATSEDARRMSIDELREALART